VRIGLIVTLRIPRLQLVTSRSGDWFNRHQHDDARTKINEGVDAKPGRRRVKNQCGQVRHIDIFEIAGEFRRGTPVCTENPIRVYRMIESAKLAR
jgi:hypothetical protein